MSKKTNQFQSNLRAFLHNKKTIKKDDQIDSNLSKQSKQLDPKNAQKNGNNSLNKKQTNQTQKKQQKIPQKKKPLINAQFYRNQRKSQPNGDYINKIHQNWWGNYNLLEKHHGFIQWLFPNSFSSRFNPSSGPLQQQQIKIFRNDLQISKRYIKSYQMMLQFYGMKLKSKISGEITQQRRINFKQRYYATLLTSFHNHMRITRILCSLSLIGFGRYAKQLSLFLDNQIHSQKGNLRQLSKYNVDKDWKIYQNYIQTEQDLNIYLKEAQKHAHVQKQKYQEQIKSKFQQDQIHLQKKQQKKNIQTQKDIKKQQNRKDKK